MTILADSPTTTFTRIEHFNTADAEPQPGRQLDLVRAAAAEFRQWFLGTGTPEWIGTFDLSTLPYPTRFGLFRAALSTTVNSDSARLNTSTAWSTTSCTDIAAVSSPAESRRN